MPYVFHRTCIGYSHKKDHKPCQDFSASYQDAERVIVTCCDGHGGRLYVRSHKGSKAASDAIIHVFRGLDNAFFRRADPELLKEKIKLFILCEYNKRIEKEVARHPIRKRETKGLKEEEIDALRFTPMKAYGTTLTGAMAYRDKLIVVSIGDTEALGIADGKLVKIFDNSDDPAGNVTYSMCQEDAFQYLRVAILNKRELDGIFLCTDGLSSPYQSYDNLLASWIHPMVRDVLLTHSLHKIDASVDNLALRRGVGDDVSLAFILSDKTPIKPYR